MTRWSKKYPYTCLRCLTKHITQDEAKAKAAICPACEKAPSEDQLNLFGGEPLEKITTV